MFWFEAAQELAVAAGKAKARSMGSVNHGLGVARVFYWGVVMLAMIGDIILCVSILAGGIIFTVANVNYLPEENSSEDNKNK